MTSNHLDSLFARAVPNLIKLDGTCPNFAREEFTQFMGLMAQEFTIRKNYGPSLAHKKV